MVAIKGKKGETSCVVVIKTEAIKVVGTIRWNSDSGD